MEKDVQPLPPPSVEVRLGLTELTNVVRSYSHLVITRWPEDDSKKEIGTAVMLRAGSHLFALTAKHCIRYRQEMYIRFEPSEGQKSYGHILKEMTRELLDIAVLELEDRPDVLACQIEQLCIDLPKPTTKESDPTTETLFWVVGFPARRVNFNKEEDHLSVHQVSFGTNCVAAEADKLTLYYHQEAYGIDQKLGCAISPLPETPEGFSGGGVWSFPAAESDELFNPMRHVRLYGIQYSWVGGKQRLLHCVPSRVIGELLMENYPDLKDRLIGLFPSLAEPK